MTAHADGEGRWSRGVSEGRIPAGLSCILVIGAADLADAPTAKDQRQCAPPHKGIPSRNVNSVGRLRIGFGEVQSIWSAMAPDVTGKHNKSSSQPAETNPKTTNNPYKSVNPKSYTHRSFFPITTRIPFVPP